MLVAESPGVRVAESTTFSFTVPIPKSDPPFRFTVPRVVDVKVPSDLHGPRSIPENPLFIGFP